MSGPFLFRGQYTRLSFTLNDAYHFSTRLKSLFTAASGYNFTYNLRSNIYA